MNTNFQMVKELNQKYNSEVEGIVSSKERQIIRETLCLAEMDVLALRNLRDFIVMFFTHKDDGGYDKMSAITYVIDTEIFNRGGEV